LTNKEHDVLDVIYIGAAAAFFAVAIAYVYGAARL
jgi:hypothetical protein